MKYKIVIILKFLGESQYTGKFFFLTSYEKNQPGAWKFGNLGKIG